MRGKRYQVRVLDVQSQLLDLELKTWDSHVEELGLKSFTNRDKGAIMY